MNDWLFAIGALVFSILFVAFCLWLGLCALINAQEQAARNDEQNWMGL